MKLHLLHGPAVTSSRKKLGEMKRRFDASSVLVFEKGADIKQLLDNLYSLSLLGDQRLVVLENLPEDLKLDYINQEGLNLIFWFNHQLDEKREVFKFVSQNKGQVLFFPEGKEISVFPFLDKLAFGDKDAFLELKRLKSAGYDSQYIITMILYLLRSLTAPPIKAPAFVMDKLKKQRVNFSQERFVNLYRSVLEVDFKIKKGLLELKQADFIVVSKFINLWSLR